MDIYFTVIIAYNSYLMKCLLEYYPQTLRSIEKFSYKIKRKIYLKSKFPDKWNYYLLTRFKEKSSKIFAENAPECRVSSVVRGWSSLKLNFIIKIF